MTTTKTISSLNKTLIRASLVALTLIFLPSRVLAICDLLVADGETYEVRGCEQYDSVCVLGTGKILIPARAQLTVLASLSVSPTAAIEFTGPAAGPCNLPETPGMFVVSNDLTMGGTFRVIDSAGGWIVNDAGSDTLMISSTGVVTSEHGKLTIDAEIINHGRITADGKDAGFDIEFTVGGVHPTSSGLFEVVTCDARMIFNLVNSLTFTGPANFNVEAGILHYKSNVTTADSADGGGLRVVLGTVKVDEGVSVRFRGKYTG